jgi:hypothetical protein
VDVAVTGSCEAAPAADSTGPAAPEPVVPGDGLTLSCRAAQNLAWLPASDPSGIAEYRMQVQTHAGDNAWHDVDGSVFTGITDKQTSVGVSCGWYYRWRVRALDGAGNLGNWSGWSEFAITLG